MRITRVRHFAVQVTVGRDTVTYCAMQKRKGGYAPIAAPIEFLKSARNETAVVAYLEGVRNIDDQVEGS